MSLAGLPARDAANAATARTLASAWPAALSMAGTAWLASAGFCASVATSDAARAAIDASASLTIASSVSQLSPLAASAAAR